MAGGSTPTVLLSVLSGLSGVQLPTVLVSVGVLGLVLAGRAVHRRFPIAVVAVVEAIGVNEVVGLDRFGVAVVGSVPAGLPHVTVPGLAPADLVALVPVAASMVVVVLAQSAATSRAYAARFDEQVDTDRDLVGLGGANLAAAVTGTFVVNGSPTKTQMVVGAGGRSQLAQLGAVAVVLVVCFAATGFLAGCRWPRWRRWCS